MKNKQYFGLCFDKLSTNGTSMHYDNIRSC